MPEETVSKSLEFLKNAKSVFNKAKLSRYLGLIFVVIATITLSLWQVGWSPDKIGWDKFFANTSLLLFLGIYGLFFGENEGSSLFKNLVTGIYQAVRDKFFDVVDKIKAKGYVDALPDYIVWRYQKDYESTCKMKMLSVRLFDPEIANLSIEQIEELREHPIKISDDKCFSKISEEQYEVIIAIKTGKVFVDYIDDYNFYLVEDGSDGEQLVTRVKRTNIRKQKISWQQRLSRIFMIILLAAILAGFFIDLPQAIQTAEMTAEEIAAAEYAAKLARIQAAKDLSSRISTLAVSISSGINTSRLLNLEDVFVLKYKISYDTTFMGCMESGTFKRIDYKEKAKIDYEQYEKEVNNVVEPEPLEITTQ